jgi:hypothetical protein
MTSRWCSTRSARPRCPANDASLGLFEWSAPDGCEIDDLDAWAAANPGLGYTVVTEQAIRSAMMTDPPAVFRTETLCQRVDSLDAAIDMACRGRPQPTRPRRWPPCATASPRASTSPPTAQHVSLALAAVLEDGRVRVEMAHAWTSTADCRRELPRLLERIKPMATGWFPSGPAAALGVDLRELARPSS